MGVAHVRRFEGAFRGASHARVSGGRKTSRKGRGARTCAFALAATLFLLLCAAPAMAEEGSPAAGKVTLKIGWMSEPDNLNPFIGVMNSDYEIWANTYDSLVGVDENLQPSTNGLAEKWEHSDDGLVWTFYLHKGMKWHDGKPITAADVEWTYNFIIKNQIANFSNQVRGIDRALALDTYTVRLVCTEPKSDLLSLYVPILPEHIWGDLSADEATKTYQNRVPIVGSGPFQVVEWKKGRYIRLEAKKDYWLRAPKVDELLFETFQNADTMAQELKKGAIDGAYLLPPAQFKKMKKTEGIKTIGFTWFNWEHLVFNCYEGKSKGHPVLRDKAFRAALSYAVDRAKLVQVAELGLALEGYTPLPPGTWSDPDYTWKPTGADARDFSIERANEALDAAGYTDEDGDGIREYKGEPIELRLWADAQLADDGRSAKLLAGWFGQLGLEIDLQVVDQGVYNDKIWNFEGDTYVPDFDMLVWQFDGWSDPGDTLACWTSDQIGGWNLSAWSSKAYDDAKKVQQAALDPDARAEALWDMQKAMWDEAPVIVLSHPLRLEAYRTDTWTGWKPMLNGKGPAFCNVTNQLAYLDVKPKAAAVTAEGGSNTGWIVLGVVLGVIVIGAVVYLVMRRGKKKVVEE